MAEATPPASTATRPSRLDWVVRPFQDFAQRGVLGGVLLLACTVVALAWANSPWGEGYFHLWETPLTVSAGGATVRGTLHLLINDGLMAVFFLLVGLEIKRELLVGELASARQAALPIAAAAGGMLVPALIYLAVNAGGLGTRGWGIPMATDIAFALGVLTILGPRVPLGLKIFLTALAIVDDMGAVVVIALFYTSAINGAALALAAVAVGVLLFLSRAGVRDLAPYVAVGLALWAFLLWSGIHATIAGVLLALTIPSRTKINAEEFSQRARHLLDEFDRSETGDLLVITSRGQQEALHAMELASGAVQAPLLRLEHRLHSAVSFGIMPLFALANAGVAFTGGAEMFGRAVTAGVALGLVAGKPIGIMLFSWLAIRAGLARLPNGVSWAALHGTAWLGGIGFTMSLFVAGLAFGEGAQLDAAKVGVLLASVLAGVVGSVLVRRATAAVRPPGQETGRG
jgi:NhaA family Na+:H+ antiporter